MGVRIGAELLDRDDPACDGRKRGNARTDRRAIDVHLAGRIGRDRSRSAVHAGQTRFGGHKAAACRDLRWSPTPFCRSRSGMLPPPRPPLVLLVREAFDQMSAVDIAVSLPGTWCGLLWPANSCSERLGTSAMEHERNPCAP